MLQGHLHVVLEVYSLCHWILIFDDFKHTQTHLHTHTHTVNSIAIQYDHPQYFALVPHQRLWQLLCVNVTAPCVLSHMILPQMLERRRGVIINVCSNIVVAPPTPLTAGYSACMVSSHFEVTTIFICVLLSLSLYTH